MIAMPYIIAIFVLDLLSIPFFSLTSAALLYRLPLAKKYMPERLSTRASASFALHALLLTSLALAVRIFGGRTLFPVFAWAGFVNALVLVYQFLNKRYFLRRPQIQRRLLIALLSAVMTAAAVIAVEAVVIVLFVIR